MHPFQFMTDDQLIAGLNDFAERAQTGEVDDTEIESVITFVDNKAQTMQSLIKTGADIRERGVCQADLARLEEISPGVTAGLNSGDYTFLASQHGLEPALNAIDWKTMGKWGIIGAIIAAIIALIAKVMGRSKTPRDPVEAVKKTLDDTKQRVEKVAQVNKTKQSEIPSVDGSKDYRKVAISRRLDQINKSLGLQLATEDYLKLPSTLKIINGDINTDAMLPFLDAMLPFLEFCFKHTLDDDSRYKFSRINTRLVNPAHSKKIKDAMEYDQKRTTLLKEKIKMLTEIALESANGVIDGGRLKEVAERNLEKVKKISSEIKKMSETGAGSGGDGTDDYTKSRLWAISQEISYSENYDDNLKTYLKVVTTADSLAKDDTCELAQDTLDDLNKVVKELQTIIAKTNSTIATSQQKIRDVRHEKKMLSDKVSKYEHSDMSNEKEKAIKSLMVLEEDSNTRQQHYFSLDAACQEMVYLCRILMSTATTISTYLEMNKAGLQIFEFLGKMCSDLIAVMAPVDMAGR